MFEQEINELELYLAQAREYREEAQYKLAVEALYKALDVERDNVHVLTQLAEIYSLMNDLERSIQYYKDILEIDEKNVSALSALFNKYFSAGKFKDALELALKMIEIEPNDKNYIKLISVYDKFADVKSLRDLVANNNLSQEVLVKVAHSFANHAFVADAESLLDKINESPEKKALCAQIYFNKNELEKARELVMDLNLETVEVLNLKGLFYIEDMKFIDAIKCFAKAVSLEASEPKYYFNLANAYFYNGWLDEAAEAYKKAVSLDLSNVDYRFALANIYFEKGEFAKAKLEVANIQHIDEEHLDTKILAALLKYQEKDYLGAKEGLEKVLKLTPDNDFVKASLAKVLVDLRLYEQAEELILSVVSANPEDAKSLTVLAYLYAELSRFNEALEFVDKVLNINKCYMPAFSVALKASFGAEKYELTQKFAQDAIAIDINFAQGYYYLGLVRKSENDFEEAIECLKRAIMYDLNNPEYYAEMARVYLENNDVKSALEYANEAVTISPNSAEYMSLYSDLAARKRRI